MKKHLFQCSKCRKTKEIELYIRGMKYCADCKDKAPTKEQYRNYILQHSRQTYTTPIKDIGHYKARE